MKTFIATTAATLAASATMALAQLAPVDNAGQGKCSDQFGQQAFCVPEISAMEGTAALAAVAAFLLIAWERRRRAA